MEEELHLTHLNPDIRSSKGNLALFHLITRDNKYNDKRQYDRDRANRIHWVRPILENWQKEPIVPILKNII